jgi:hypothetical protein
MGMMLGKSHISPLRQNQVNTTFTGPHLSHFRLQLPNAAPQQRLRCVYVGRIKVEVQQIRMVLGLFNRHFQSSLPDIIVVTSILERSLGGSGRVGTDI